MHTSELSRLLEALTGQRPPMGEAVSAITTFPASGLGYSQLNELLLMLGYDRITHAYFQYLVDDTLEYIPGSSICSISAFRDGVDRARKLSLLLFGNVKFGFKRLARDSDQLLYYHVSTRPLDPTSLKQRHDAIHPVIPIDPSETFYLGYVVQKELKAAIERDPIDSRALEGLAVLDRVREAGARNHQAYLVSDHLDVYIATSMRKRHEYVEVSEIASRIFREEKIGDLKLRWFDPTQAYCADRIDKGLAEALMLKRAKCTLYLAQESDTLGKDSELASTLAQGKPVIAFVPSPSEKDVRELVQNLSELYSTPPNRIILERLQALAPELAWQDGEIRSWLETPSAIDTEAALSKLVYITGEHYRKRAETLVESHPLGIQVNLDTGVANGVLVARSISDCAELIYRIVTTTLDFDIEETVIAGVTYYLLREKVSKCVFRVMTGDAMLTNAFWNFYLGASE
jgi:hypothetical protein